MTHQFSKNALFSAFSVLLVALLAACSTPEDSAATGLAATTDTEADSGATGQSDGAEAAADTTAATADAGPQQPALEPKGLVYAHDPVTDKGQTIEVTLTKPITDDGTLKSNWVEIRNCLNKDGGPPMKFQGIEAGKFCVEDRIATPGADGHYTHHVPPKDPSDPNDPFAEVQMYHHVNRMHDYFKDTHGLTDVDFPLHALINVQMNLSPIAATFMGTKPGWAGMANAAFMPPEAIKQLSLPPRDNGAIVFFQWEDTDFSYDTSVIYHEYTHAMIGTTRLQGARLSLFGMDGWPGAMNEGFADYFAASMNDFPVIGAHALAVVASHLVRDLSKKRTCPEHITTEIHADGKIVGAALWGLRKKFGQVKADAMVLGALQSFTQATSLDGAVKLILAEADKQGVKAEAKAILDEFGIVGCVPAKEWTAWNYLQSPDLLPYTVEGQQGGGGQQLKHGMPAYVQYWFDVPAGTHAVELSFEANGQGGFGGGGAVNMDLAIRRDKPVTVNIFGGDTISDARFTPKANPAKSSIRTVTLTNGCFTTGSGKMYGLLLNKGGKAQVTWLDIKYKKSGDTLINPHNCPQ